MKNIVIAILAKDKDYCLDFYLKCILNQTIDKKRIHLYIKTNDNKDNTQEILENFIKKHGQKYASVYYNSESISEKLKKFSEHQWNAERFKILSKIRQESIDFAIEKNAHYFVADCDNFIVNDTIEYLYNFKNLGVVGPMLKLTKNHFYSNYHNVANETGYFKNNDEYFQIWRRDIKGAIQVDTLHCTYFINNNLLKHITYDDNSNRYEYAIFSDNLRKIKIPQYLINSRFFGFLFLNDQIKISFNEFIAKNWESEYISMNEKYDPSKRTVHFIHRADKLNTGDMVCNAGNYYTFHGFNKKTHDIYKPNFSQIKKDDIVIWSGGGLLNCIESWNVNINKSLEICNNVYGWAIGFNTHKGDEKRIKTKINFHKFKHLGLRDYLKSYPDNMSYLPCSSCNLSQLQKNYKIKREIGVVEHHHFPLDYADKEKINNTSDINDFIRFLGESKTIITTTYHCLYFSMLLNKNAVLHSSFSKKFDNLKYEFSKVGENIKNIDYGNYLQESIDLNDKFYVKILKEI